MNWEIGWEDPPWAPEITPSRGERCLVYRKRAHMTQGEVADSIGCTHAAISQMEKGIIRVDRLEEFWKVFNS